VHPEDHRGINAGDIDTERMPVLDPRPLTAITNLKPVLVRGPPLDRGGVAAEGVAKDPDTLIVESLDAEIDRCPIRSTGVQELTPGRRHGVAEEGVDIVPSRDPVHLRVGAGRDSLIKHLNRVWQESAV